MKWLLKLADILNVKADIIMILIIVKKSHR